MRRFLMILTLVLAAGAVNAQDTREVTKFAVKEQVHFTLDKGEQKDFSTQLAKGQYYIVCDMKRMSGTPGNMIGKVQLLKSNGSMIDANLLFINELGTVARVGKKFNMDKPLAVRLRASNDEPATEYWMTIIPAQEMKWMPFAFWKDPFKPLGIGEKEGKGGNLEKNDFTFHSIQFQPGKYDVSLYMKRVDGQNSNVIGELEEFDSLGFRVESWVLNLNEIGQEARQEKRLVVLKPQTIIFRVTDIDAPVEYIIGIEKATD